MEKHGISTAPGTCGELVQGFCGTGKPFHVTCPINVYASAKLVVHDAPRFSISGLPDYAAKMRRAIEHTARFFKLDKVCVDVEHHTSLETGKGMGSSTADILSVATALANACGKELTVRELAMIATSIESSDGTMYPGIVAVNHKNGELLQTFEWWPELHIAMIVPTEILDTAHVRFTGKAALASRFDEILATLQHASVNADEEAFAQAALESAILNQEFVPNAYFEKLKNRISELGAIGLNVAHTGTMVGVLFNSSDEGGYRCKAALPKLRALLGDPCVVHPVRIESERAW
jgi:L-threonine kinase